ncbi:MAG: Maf family protein [Acutalibacteraceae bacterium]|nr:Maf family protein [Acutalibacteraceae bacterium]
MLVLASSSPRRKELMEMLGYDFVVKCADCDENVENLSCENAVKELSVRKAKSVAEKCGCDDVIIGSDTLVCIDSKKLGKPIDNNDAFNMLKTLSGRIHTVYTAVSIIHQNSIQTFVSKTDVEFNDLDDITIRNYIESGDCKDKAGAYGIQGKGAVLVKRIIGDFYTVMGLPVSQLYFKLKSMGILPSN